MSKIFQTTKSFKCGRIYRFCSKFIIVLLLWGPIIFRLIHSTHVEDVKPVRESYSTKRWKYLILYGIVIHRVYLKFYDKSIRCFPLSHLIVGNWKTIVRCIVGIPSTVIGRILGWQERHPTRGSPLGCLIEKECSPFQSVISEVFYLLILHFYHQCSSAYIFIHISMELGTLGSVIFIQDLCVTLLISLTQSGKLTRYYPI